MAVFKTYVRDRDKPIETVGITGLRENFGRDDGIEEPYWGPSMGSCHIQLQGKAWLQGYFRRRETTTGNTSAFASYWTPVIASFRFSEMRSNVTIDKHSSKADLTT